MAQGTFGTAISCIDGRVQGPVDAWVKANAQVDFVDTVTVPGPDKALTQGTPEQIAALRGPVEISVNAHGSKVVAVAGKVTPETYGLYLLDLEHGTICVYQYLPATRKLRLMAARTFLFDRKLEVYNNAAPTPREVKHLVEQQRSLRTAPGQPK